MWVTQCVRKASPACAWHCCHLCLRSVSAHKSAGNNIRLGQPSSIQTSSSCEAQQHEVKRLSPKMHKALREAQSGTAASTQRHASDCVQQTAAASSGDRLRILRAATHGLPKARRHSATQHKRTLRVPPHMPGSLPPCVGTNPGVN